MSIYKQTTDEYGRTPLLELIQAVEPLDTPGKKLSAIVLICQEIHRRGYLASEHPEVARTIDEDRTFAIGLVQGIACRP